MLTCGGGSAAAAQAVPCSASPLPEAIKIRGTFTEEGATGPFETTIDLRDGFSRTIRTNGIQRSLNGFNGVAWSFANGIPTVTDVPPLMRDWAARAFVARLGWQDATVQASAVRTAGGNVERTYDLPQTSRVTVVSGSRGSLPSRVAIDADEGIETTTFSDWRCVLGMNYPFEQTQNESTGETQTMDVSSVEAVRVARDAFDAPRPRAHGHVGEYRATAFRYIGKHDRHIIVDARIGSAAVPLVFDTGAANYFGPKAAQALGLSVSGGLTITGIGSGSSAGGFARIKEMTIANATLEDEVAIVAPLPWPESPDAPAGSAGLEFLAEFRTTIDFPNSTIAFSDFDEPMPAGGLQLPLRTIGHVPAVEAAVNGLTAWFSVDTGDATGITLFKAFADRAGVVADSSDQTLAGGGGGNTKLLGSRLREFSIGGVSVANPSVRVSGATAGVFASRSMGGNLGNGLLRCFRVTFDYRHREMYLSNAPTTQVCLQQLAE